MPSECVSERYVCVCVCVCVCVSVSVSLCGLVWVCAHVYVPINSAHFNFVGDLFLHTLTIKVFSFVCASRRLFTSHTG